MNCGAAAQSSAAASNASFAEAVPTPIASPASANPAQPVVQPPVYAPAPGQAVYVQPNGQPMYYVPSGAAPHAHAGHQLNLLHGLQARLQSLASTEQLEGFSLKQMFSEVFKRRSEDEIEDYLLVGTSRTTPPIDVCQTGWPKPWLFFRVLVILAVTYTVFTITLLHLPDAGNLIPAVMFIGAFAVPLTTLAFFFEMNSPRNVSVHRIVTLFLYGAVVSLIFALVGYELPILGSLGAIAAGVVEEVAKLLTVVVVIRGVKYKYILNGLLFGATVGAGFAAFETAGYALNKGLLAGHDLASGVTNMLAVLSIRAFLTPWGHVAWTAIAAAALWRVKGAQRLKPSMFFDSRFLKAFMIPVVLHIAWDCPWQLPFEGNAIISAVVSWYVVFGLVQQGLRQVKEEQKLQLQQTLQRVETSMQPVGSVAVS
ncbi:MAG TPA: PrsW family glutamic-type intramembrane protease [Acidobacteriaceae bacterium]|nr:PrsW family glutamic-type intramembrane protease [Acidobacteriaceae bacterium]